MARRTKEDAEVTRHRLLDAAEQVFHARGVSGASLADVAREASLTRGAIYWHFKDKLALFDAMMQRAILPIEQVLTATSRRGCSPVERVLACLDLLFRTIENDARMRKVFEIAMLKVEHVGELAAVQQRWVSGAERLTALLEQDLALAFSERKQAAAVTPASAARGLQALFDGMLYAWMLRQGGFPLEEQGMMHVRLYLHGLGLLSMEKMSAASREIQKME